MAVRKAMASEGGRAREVLKQERREWEELFRASEELADDDSRGRSAMEGQGGYRRLAVGRAPPKKRPPTACLIAGAH